MGIKAAFSEGEFRSRARAFIQTDEKLQIELLQELGELCVKHARELPEAESYTDRTGNLRSSIGYVVFKDGVAIRSFYENTKGGTIGAQKGRALADQVGKDRKGLCLIVTAGMHYAIYVERDGHAVLSSAELLAQQELPRMIATLSKDISSLAP